MNFLPDALDEYVIKNSQKEPKLLTTAQGNIPKNITTTYGKWSLSR